MTSELNSFKEFMKSREEAARAYVSGDPALVDSIATRISPATFFPPKGGYQQGANDVSLTYHQDSAIFKGNGQTSFEILQMAASDGLAYWVGFQRALVYMGNNTEAISMNLRVTELFRNEDNKWKLVHRHADPLFSKSTSNN